MKFMPKKGEVSTTAKEVVEYVKNLYVEMVNNFVPSLVWDIDEYVPNHESFHIRIDDGDEYGDSQEYIYLMVESDPAGVNKVGSINILFGEVYHFDNTEMAIEFIDNELEPLLLKLHEKCDAGYGYVSFYVEK